MNTKIKLLLMVSLLVGFNSTFANTSTNLQASANLENICSISVSNADFGKLTFVPNEPNFLKQTSNEISVKCTNKTVYVLKGMKGELFSAANNYYGYSLTGANSGSKLGYIMFIGNEGFGENNPSTSTIANGEIQKKILSFALYAYESYPGYSPNPDVYSSSYTIDLEY